MRRGTPLLAAVGALLVSAAPASARPTRCGRVEVPRLHRRAKVQVRRGPESCAAGKRLIRDAFTAERTRHWNYRAPDHTVVWRVDGWACQIGLGATETFCARGARHVDGSVRTDDGWAF